MTEYLSLKEASRKYGYEVSTIRRWLKESRIQGLKGPTANSPWKVSTDSLQQLLNDGAHAGQNNKIEVTLIALPFASLLQSWSDVLDTRLSNNEVRSLTKQERTQTQQALQELRGWLDDLGAELDP